ADSMDWRAGEERHQDAASGGPVATQERQVRSGHHRKQDRAEHSGRRKTAADLVTARTPMAPILALEKISKRFGAVVVADGIDLALNDGEALGIIGPNGAGKTTLFGVATGTVNPDAGRVMFAGNDVTGFPAERRCRMGLARSFQIPQPFSGMSVFE